jgi:hypothetical protein
MAELEDHEALFAITEAVGPATAYLARRAFEQAAQEAGQRCLDLLSYARSFTPVRVERAALRLIDHGLDDIASLRFLLEHEMDILVPRPDAEFDGQLRLGLSPADLSHET